MYICIYTCAYIYQLCIGARLNSHPVILSHIEDLESHTFASDLISCLAYTIPDSKARQLHHFAEHLQRVLLCPYGEFI